MIDLIQIITIPEFISGGGAENFHICNLTAASEQTGRAGQGLLPSSLHLGKLRPGDTGEAWDKDDPLGKWQSRLVPRTTDSPPLESHPTSKGTHLALTWNS